MAQARAVLRRAPLGLKPRKLEARSAPRPQFWVVGSSGGRSVGLRAVCAGSHWRVARGLCGLASLGDWAPGARLAAARTDLTGRGRSGLGSLGGALCIFKGCGSSLWNYLGIDAGQPCQRLETKRLKYVTGCLSGAKLGRCPFAAPICAARRRGPRLPLTLSDKRAWWVGWVVHGSRGALVRRRRGVLMAFYVGSWRAYTTGLSVWCESVYATATAWADRA